MKTSSKDSFPNIDHSILSPHLKKDRRLHLNYRVSSEYERFSCYSFYSTKEDWALVGVAVQEHRISKKGDSADGNNHFVGKEWQ
jgi:hypothetical protein